MHRLCPPPVPHGLEIQAILSSTARLNHAGISAVFSSKVRPSVISASQVWVPSALFVELSKM